MDFQTPDTAKINHADIVFLATLCRLEPALDINTNVFTVDVRMNITTYGEQAVFADIFVIRIRFRQQDISAFRLRDRIARMITAITDFREKAYRNSVMTIKLVGFNRQLTRLSSKVGMRIRFRFQPRIERITAVLKLGLKCVQINNLLLVSIAFMDLDLEF